MSQLGKQKSSSCLSAAGTLCCLLQPAVKGPEQLSVLLYTIATTADTCLPCAAEDDHQPSFTQQQAQFMEAKGIMLSGTPLYLDMQATTPMDPRVLDRMLPFMTEQYGNPHSRTHYYGWESEDAVEVARKQARLHKLPQAQLTATGYFGLLKGSGAPARLIYKYS